MSEIEVDAIEPAAVSPSPIGPTPADHVPWSARLAVAWADLVVVAGLTTAMIGTVILAGYPLSIRALPWAVVVALLGWGAACGIMLRVRRGTPGMVLAGLEFVEEVAGTRLLWTIAAAGFSALLLGLPALPGGHTASLLSVASGSILGARPEAPTP
ncbi:MAG: hypothetical protein ABFS37_07505 [Acidobacteriota bacterium]